MPPLPAVILAAGRSSRMGRDKALLPLHRSTFLETLLRAFEGLAEPVVVVLGHHAERIEPALPSKPALQVVRNPRYDLGMLSSLQAGLGAIPSDAPAAFFALIDHPAVSPGALGALAEAWRRRQPAVVIPAYRSRRGHPIVVSRPVIDDLLRLPPGATPKDAIRRYAEQTLVIEVDDCGVVDDIDDPAAYETLLARLRESESGGARGWSGSSPGESQSR